ncbi:glycosyltransferase family 4 protein, partial [Patescibacteria group bacterium]
GQVLPMGSAARIAASTYKIPYSVFTYAMDVELARQHWRRKNSLSKVFNDAQHIFTISEDTRARIIKAGGESSKIVKITPGLDTGEFLAGHDLLATKTEELRQRYHLEGKKVIVTVGRAVSRKGQDTVLKALPKILREIPDAHYVVAGGGAYLDSLKQIAKSLGIQKQVTFTNRFPEDEKTALYNLGDVFAMISRVEKSTDIEGFGIVYLEANALGKPVVAGRSGGVEDAVIDDKTGLLVNDPTDEGEVATTIIKLLKNPALAKQLGEQGEARVKQDFNWDELVAKLKKYL